MCFFFFFSSRRRHTRCSRDWSSDVCSSDLRPERPRGARAWRGSAMRHRRDGFKLGRVTAHRWALFRNLLVALFRHERIQTTEAKAKAVRGLAEQMITLAKRDTLHARRQVLAM